MSLPVLWAASGRKRYGNYNVTGDVMLVVSFLFFSHQWPGKEEGERPPSPSYPLPGVNLFPFPSPSLWPSLLLAGF